MSYSLTQASSILLIKRHSLLRFEQTIPELLGCSMRAAHARYSDKDFALLREQLIDIYARGVSLEQHLAVLQISESAQTQGTRPSGGDTPLHAASGQPQAAADPDPDPDSRDNKPEKPAFAGDKGQPVDVDVDADVDVDGVADVDADVDADADGDIQSLVELPEDGPNDWYSEKLFAEAQEQRASTLAKEDALVLVPQQSFALPSADGASQPAPQDYAAERSVFESDVSDNLVVSPSPATSGADILAVSHVDTPTVNHVDTPTVNTDTPTIGASQPAAQISGQKPHSTTAVAQAMSAEQHHRPGTLAEPEAENPGQEQSAAVQQQRQPTKASTAQPPAIAEQLATHGNPLGWITPDRVPAQHSWARQPAQKPPGPGLQERLTWLEEVAKLGQLEDERGSLSAILARRK